MLTDIVGAWVEAADTTEHTGAEQGSCTGDGEAGNVLALVARAMAATALVVL